MTMNELKTKITKANEKKNANYTEIPSALVSDMEKVNAESVSEYCKGIASLENADFINTFFNVSIEKGLNEKALEKAMKNAFSVDIVVLSINDNGLIEMQTKAKPIFFSDILKAKIELLAFSHSDKKPTKQDRITANKHFFGENGIGYLELLTHSARKFTSIEDNTEKPNANYEKAFSEISASKSERCQIGNPKRLAFWISGLSSRIAVLAITTQSSGKLFSSCPMKTFAPNFLTF